LLIQASRFSKPVFFVMSSRVSLKSQYFSISWKINKWVKWNMLDITTALIPSNQYSNAICPNLANELELEAEYEGIGRGRSEQHIHGE
jgi:hypothetical protein